MRWLAAILAPKQGEQFSAREPVDPGHLMLISSAARPLVLDFASRARQAGQGWRRLCPAAAPRDMELVEVPLSGPQSQVLRDDVCRVFQAWHLGNGQLRARSNLILQPQIPNV